MNERCPLCKKSFVKDGAICQWCVNECRKQLFAIPQLVVAAEDFLEPGKSGRGSSNGEISIGVNLNALDYVSGIELCGKLWAWEDNVREARKADGAHVDDRPEPRGPISERVKISCEFLSVNFEWLRKRDFFFDFAEEIKGLHAQGIQATRQTSERTTRLRCPADLGDTLCQGWLTIENVELNEVIHCRKCRTDWSLAWLIHVALSVPDQSFWVDVDAMAQFFMLTPKQVRSFVKKHKIKVWGPLIEIAAFKAKFDEVKINQERQI